MTDKNFTDTETDMTDAGQEIIKILCDVSTDSTETDRVLDLITSDYTVAHMIAFI